ncbi:MAG TPA: LCP family protein, partial [Actinomycetota bacterium]|nr:LCP family protein [Actinomycetota bacterium]
MPRRLFLLLAGLLSLGLGVASTGAIAMLNYIEGSLKQTHVEGLDSPRASTGPRSDLEGQVLNVLVIGSDSREVLSDEKQVLDGDETLVEGQRSDTIILVHLDPRRGKAVLVHFPRDLRVEIPGHGLDRINTAYNRGGPS